MKKNIKYLVLVPDGMADMALEELGGKTPLEVAKTPYMGQLAKVSKVGLVRTVPEGFEPASDVANLSILGFDPKAYYTGRGPLEAANMDIDLKATEVAFRCNVVTVDGSILIDYSAGHIKNKEAGTLIDHLNAVLGVKGFKFYLGMSYRHLLIIDTSVENIPNKEQFVKLNLLPPHNIMGEDFEKYLPKGSKAAEIISSLTKESYNILNEHSINQIRVDLSENPGNMIWLWGQGIKPAFPNFKTLHGISGVVVSAVNLINGMGKLLGLKILEIEGATGYYDTNYLGKAEAALDELVSGKDFAYVHVEASDEAGHNADLREKILSIERFDKYIIGTLVEGLKKSGFDFRILLMPDHATPVSMRKHISVPVPFLLYDTRDSVEKGPEYFSEQTAANSGFYLEHGYELMDLLLSSEDAD